jgi:hypothetical protein
MPSRSRNNRFCALVEVEPEPVVRYSLPESWARHSPEAVRAVAAVQDGTAYELYLPENSDISWGDLAWADDWVTEQRARDERKRLGIPEPAPIVRSVTPPRLAPVVEEPEHFRAWDNSDAESEEAEWIRGAKGMLEKEIHLDENGEPEECRFFNSSHGCRAGADCPYKHIQRAQQEIECRFFKTPRGCRSGAKCIYKHC